jgi:hypothetical protein
MPITLIREWLITCGLDLKKDGSIEKRQLRQDYRGYYRLICDKDLEGIVAKHRLAPYSSTPQSWFKVLNPDYSQKRGRKEMFEKFRNQSEQVAATHGVFSPGLFGQ